VISLLFHLGRQLAGSRILIVEAYCPEEVALGRPASPLLAGELRGGHRTATRHAETGDLVQDPEGRWVEGPALDWETLPARVEAVVVERIGRLAQPLRAALRVASVEGEVFTAEVVARVRATDEREMLGCLSGELDRKHRGLGSLSLLLKY
jgi:hypothetical protein